MKDFKNKIVVITGAGSGIGKATALEFAKLGAILGLNDYAMTNLEEIKGELDAMGAKYYAEGFDVSNKDAFKQFAENVKTELGAADIIINNAGIASTSGDYLSIGLEAAERVMRVNYWSVVYGTTFFTPQLLENKKQAAIVNISSLNGLAGFPAASDYCSSKAAVKGFTESIAYDLYDTNINVHCVHPGGIATNIATKRPDGEEISKDTYDGYEKAYLKTTPQTMALEIIKGIRKNKFRILAGEMILTSYFGILALPFKTFMKTVLSDYKRKGVMSLIEKSRIKYK